MNYLNGPPTTPLPASTNQGSFQTLINQLPTPVDESIIQRINHKVDTMQKNYNLYFSRNRLISAMAILENEVNEIENEINRL